MTDEHAERAQALYEACPTPKPAWEQLGDVTRGVWIERAMAEEKKESTEKDE